MKRKNKRKVLIVCMVILCLLTSCGVKSDEIKNEIKQELTENQIAWIADIDGPLRDGLAQAAGVNEFLSDEERNQRLDTLIQRIETENLEDYEIILSIQELISDIRIAHMDFCPKEDYKGESKETYLVFVKWFADGAHIIATLEEDKEYIGARLVAINGMDMDEILKRYDRIYSNETEGWLYYKWEQESTKFGFMQNELEYLGIIEQGDTEIVLTLEKDGTCFEWCEEVTKLDGSQTIEIASVYNQIPTLPYGDYIFWGKGEPPFYYELDKEHRTMYVQYNECLDPTVKGIVKDVSDYPRFDEFFDSMIQEMKENEADIDSFVVDLRNNTGGSEFLWENAIKKHRSYLNQYPIKMLIGKGTFSAGQDAIDMTLYMFDDVTLYGEETGQAIHNYTSKIAVEMENTGGTLQIPDHQDKCYVIDDRADDIYAGVVPDVEVVQTFEGYIKGLDEVYLRAVTE